MSRRIVYRLDWRQAEEVRRRRRAGETWTSIAEWLGWSAHRAAHNVRGALARAPKAPQNSADTGLLRREAAAARAEADPVLARRCATCGHPNYRLRRLTKDGWDALAVGFVRLGGRWLCPDCAPRPKPPTDFQREYGAHPDAYRVLL